MSGEKLKALNDIKCWMAQRGGVRKGRMVLIKSLCRTGDRSDSEGLQTWLWGSGSINASLVL